MLCFGSVCCVLAVCVVFWQCVLCFGCVCCVLTVCVVFCTCGPPYKIDRKYQKQQEFTTKPAKTKKYLQKNQGGVKVEPASELSLVSGNYH